MDMTKNHYGSKLKKPSKGFKKRGGKPLLFSKAKKTGKAKKVLAPLDLKTKERKPQMCRWG